MVKFRKETYHFWIWRF